MVLDSMAPARRRLVLAVAAIVLVAVVAAVVLVVVNRSDDTVTPVAQDQPGPVLLVPGYGGSLTSITVLRDDLRKAGKTAEDVIPPGDGTGDIKEQAANLSEVVDQELAHTGAKSVDIVGYSAGGVVLRYYIAELGGGSKVRRAITLASPHHGTAVAEAAAGVIAGACNAACLQLEPDSELLDQLNAGDESPPGPRWVAIWTTDDKTVVPPESGELQGAVTYSVQLICPGLDVQHGDVPRTPAVEKMVLFSLGVDLPTRPPTSVCS